MLIVFVEFKSSERHFHIMVGRHCWLVLLLRNRRFNFALFGLVDWVSFFGHFLVTPFQCFVVWCKLNNVVIKRNLNISLVLCTSGMV